MLQNISSRENEHIKHACKVAASAAYRRETNLFFAEGRRLCTDLAQNQKPAAAFIEKNFLKQNPQLENLAQENYVVNEPVAAKLTTVQAPQGIWCLFERPALDWSQTQPAQGLLFCENIQDPANIGTLVRTAAAFGLGGVACAGSTADPFAPKALRASMGAVLRIPLFAEKNLPQRVAQLQQKGVTFYAAALDSGALQVGSFGVQGAWALLIGNEGNGLSAEALAVADRQVYLPMHNGVESLNAAAAGAVLMYALSNS